MYSLRNPVIVDIDGVYTPWSSWSDCSATCGNKGVQIRVRLCTQQPPQENGQKCNLYGPDSETRSCSLRTCPTRT